MLWAARRVGRPVKWTQTRNEAHISDDDARDNIVDAALALDKDGKFLGVRIRSYGNLGAFVSFRGAMPPVVNIGTVVGTYTTPALHVAISGMLTNTHCTSPYRGAGRPEATLHDRAADRHRRRRNGASIRRSCAAATPSRRETMPYKTPLTFTYDSGRFEENLDRTMKLADWARLRGAAQRSGEARQAARHRHLQHHRAGRRSDLRDCRNPLRSARRHDLRHRLDLARPGPRHDPDADAGRIGSASIREQIKFIQGDTDAVAFGMGTGGSRSTTMSGGAIVAGQRQSRRQGQEARRAYARSVRGRYRVQGRPLHHRRHRPRASASTK